MTAKLKFPSGTRGLHLTAMYELLCSTQKLLVSQSRDNSIEVDPKEGHGRKPLSYSAEGGYEQVVKLLVDTGAGVNVQGGGYGGAL